MDVVALGELLIDFTENGISSQGNPLFEANPGGAPCNVLAMLTKLGHKTAFIGKVGNDFFGKQLEQTIMEVGIDASGLQKDDDVHTTLALVHTYPDGDRDFSFYRNPGADMMLKEEEVPEELIKGTRIFHFGTLSMTHEGVRNATKKALRAAKEAGAVISFDPNLREPLWNSLDEAKEQVLLQHEVLFLLHFVHLRVSWTVCQNERFVFPLSTLPGLPLLSASYLHQDFCKTKNPCLHPDKYVPVLTSYVRHHLSVSLMHQSRLP